MDYLVLKNIQVSNANAISGFTWGFPAVSHFLGYVHALSRKTQQSEYGFTLGACAIVCHQHQVHAYRDNPYEPFAFALTRNPLTKEGNTAPIVEEGRMHLTVSLVIECEGIDRVTEQSELAQLEFIKGLAERHKLAGGRISAIGKCYFSKEKDTSILRRLLPGFVLIDRSDYLAQSPILDKDGEDKNKPQQSAALQNWLDFSALKYRATNEPLSIKEEKNEQDKENLNVNWAQIRSPFEGFLVPLQIGYKKIAPTYNPGEVAHARDNETPVSFVEAIYSVGEWIGSPSRLDSIEQALWQHHYASPYYVCHTQSRLAADVEPHDIDDNFDEFND